jgi:hypothetical protein
MNIDELFRRKQDLLYAIRATETVAQYCSTPSLIDMHRAAIEYYKQELLKTQEEIDAQKN